MIGYLRGTVLEIDEGRIILDVVGVGYEVNTLGLEIKQEDQLSLYIHTHVKEDELKLFGFKTKSDLMVFKKLLSVSGVGPKSALLIVGIHKSEKVIRYVCNQQADKLKVKGIGQKTAQKIVLELKSKFDKKQFQLSQEPEDLDDNQIDKTEVEQALLNLGYNLREIDNFFLENKIEKEDNLQTILRKAFDYLRK